MSLNNKRIYKKEKLFKLRIQVRSFLNDNDLLRLDKKIKRNH